MSLGVGLAVVRLMAEPSGGARTAESAKGQGSTFVVALPGYDCRGGFLPEASSIASSLFRKKAGVATKIGRHRRIRSRLPGSANMPSSRKKTRARTVPTPGAARRGQPQRNARRGDARTGGDARHRNTARPDAVADGGPETGLAPGIAPPHDSRRGRGRETRPQTSGSREGAGPRLLADVGRMCQRMNSLGERQPGRICETRLG